MTKSRHIAPPRRPWEEHELSVMRRNYAHFPTAKIAEQLGRTLRQVYSQAKNLGLKKSAAYLASEAAHRLKGDSPMCIAHQFKPGRVPWNKGVPGSTGKHPNTRANQFRPGNRPHTWVPVGSRRINSDGYLELKFSDAPGRADQRWRGVHRMVWEAAHGPCPAGSVIVFKPDRHTTDEARITLDVLECVTRAENMRRNSVHRLPKELATLVQLRGALNRKINAMDKA